MTLKRRITVFSIAGLVVATVAAVYYMPHWQQTVTAVSKGGRRGGPPASEPVPVLAAAVRAADVPVYLDGVGTAKALNTVTVRSQVDGKIIEVLFAEGQDVPKGYLLAKIDPATYQAAFDQTAGKNRVAGRRIVVGESIILAGDDGDGHGALQVSAGRATSAVLPCPQAVPRPIARFAERRSGCGPQFRHRTPEGARKA
jgi:multidrug efflux pump subunit AcrA (membrane-fusion protein)